MTKGRAGRAAFSLALAVASAMGFMSVAGAEPGGGTTGQTVCTYDSSTGLTTCEVNASSLTSAQSGSTSYWHFVLNSVPDGVVPESLQVCWGTYCVTQPPWVIPADDSNLCHTDVAGGEPCGSNHGTWHFFVELNTYNSDAGGNPLTPTSATVVMPTDVTGSNVNFVLSEAPAPGVVTTTTTEPSTTTTTTPSTTTTTEPSTTTTTTPSTTTTTTEPSTTTTTGGTTLPEVTSTTSATTTTGGEEAPETATSTTVAQSTVVTVPATQTGEPWDTISWKLLVSAAGLAGAVILFPWKRRRLGNR